jgi:HK97 family phage portal protein
LGIATNIAEWREARRKKRLLKAALPSESNTPSRRLLAYSWLPHWLQGDYTLRNSELLFSAVSRISNALSTMPLHLYKGAAQSKNDLSDMMGAEPNPNMTGCQFIKTLEACRCTSGNCYAIKVYGLDGGLDRVDVLDPLRVAPVFDLDSGELWYRIRPEKGREYHVHNYYVIHVPFLSTNGFSGISPVAVLNGTLGYSDEIEAFSAKQLKQGVNAAVVLEAPANLGEAQKKAMVESFMETYRETSGNILLLESGVTAKSLNMSPVDSKIFEVEKITRSKVAMVYNIPTHLLGDYSESRLRSPEQLVLEFLMLTMLPIVTAYEQEFDRKLLTREQRRRGFHFKFDMDAILRADAATQAEVNYKAVRSAWKTPDEIRASYSQPPYANGIGKHPMISQDLATLDYTVNVKPSVLAGGQANGTPPPGMLPEPEPAPAQDPDGGEA